MSTSNQSSLKQWSDWLQAIGTVVAILVGLGALYTFWIQIKPLRVVPVVTDVNGVGGWTQSGGDGDMHTGGNDTVPVNCRSILYHDDAAVYLILYFDCTEHKGNHTRYAGTRTFRLFDADENGGGIIRKIKTTTGSVRADFSTESVGSNHGTTPFDVSNSYWNNLAFSIDSSDSNDAGIVGVRGEISFVVVLDEQPFESPWSAVETEASKE